MELAGDFACNPNQGEHLVRSGGEGEGMDPPWRYADTKKGSATACDVRVQVSRKESRIEAQGRRMNQTGVAFPPVYRRGDIRDITLNLHIGERALVSIESLPQKQNTEVTGCEF